MSSQKPAETPTKEPLGDGTKGDAPKQGSRLRAFGGNVLALFVSLLVALLLGELALAVLGMEYSASLYTGDWQTGWARRPDAEGFQIGEATQYVRINSEGLRDEEHALPKPVDTFRIAVLGGTRRPRSRSPTERAYWSAPKTASASALRWREEGRVVNFGVGGFGQGHELTTPRSRVGKYAPDLVLTQDYLGNDIFNNSREMSKAQDQTVPVLRLRGRPAGPRPATS